jgi:hypothetical protein
VILRWLFVRESRGPRVGSPIVKPVDSRYAIQSVIGRFGPELRFIAVSRAPIKSTFSKIRVQTQDLRDSERKSSV